ncbi:MAG: hypothetical protein K2X39_08955 [Silvanigrellaceae bacterium]|nr:hypothetical protein [Silvanigrellaceae bacterium]
MKSNRCPYHVKQGLVNAEGNLVLSDVCGVKSACGSGCSFAPFKDDTFKNCPRHLGQISNSERQVLMPKNDLEYLPETNSFGNFSEIDLL